MVRCSWQPTTNRPMSFHDVQTRNGFDDETLRQLPDNIEGGNESAARHAWLQAPKRTRVRPEMVLEVRGAEIR